MKKFSYFLLSAAVVALVSCGKEGEQGPVGPAGPAGATGAAGDDADFIAVIDTIPGADWAGATYIEYVKPYITEDIYENGVVILNVADDFGYWNSVPSDFHPISGYGYAWNPEDNVGIIGFESDGTVTTDQIIKVTTMTMRAYQELVALGIEDDMVAAEAYFANKK